MFDAKLNRNVPKGAVDHATEMGIFANGMVHVNQYDDYYTVSRKKRGSTFDIITLEIHARFL